MRVFLCSFESFSLAVPIKYISSVVLLHGNQETAVEYDNRFFNTYISLPILFNFPVTETKHGIILKKNDDENDIDDDSLMQNRSILLTTEIINEADIPDEKIFSVPKILNIMQFSFYINGIVFAFEKSGNTINPGISNRDMILLLNPVQLLNNINKELKT